MDGGCSLLLVPWCSVSTLRAACYRAESGAVLHSGGLKIVGFVHILKRVCWERTEKRNRCCVFVQVSLCWRKACAHVGWERSCVCVHVSWGVLGFCFRGRGAVLHWKVLLCSTCWIRTSSFPWSCPLRAPPPTHSPLPICIKRRQAEMWQTNLAHTHTPPWTPHLPTKKAENTPALRFPKRQLNAEFWSPEGGALTLNLLPSLLQDGNVHLKTSRLHRVPLPRRSLPLSLSAPLSGRQVPIKPLIYGAGCIPWAPAKEEAEIWGDDAGKRRRLANILSPHNLSNRGKASAEICQRCGTPCPPSRPW